MQIEIKKIFFWKLLYLNGLMMFYQQLTGHVAGDHLRRPLVFLWSFLRLAIFSLWLLVCDLLNQVYSVWVSNDILNRAKTLHSNCLLLFSERSTSLQELQAMKPLVL